MKNFFQNVILQNLKTVILAAVLGLGVSVVSAAWVNPPALPPDCPPGSQGCNPPLHAGPEGQQKQGRLIIGSGLAPDKVGLRIVNGKVGIGLTDEPTQQLDVAGFSKSREGFCIGGNCIESWGGSSGPDVPSGAIVAAFNSSACPSGWSPFTAANGRVIIGAGNSLTVGSTNHTVGQIGGQEKIVQTENNLPGHTHGVSGTYGNWINNLGSKQQNFCTNQSCSNSSYIITGGQFFTPSIQQNNGGAQAMDVLDPFVALTYCSKDLP